MNFQTIPPVNGSTDLLDYAFRAGRQAERKRPKQKSRAKDQTYFLRKIESTRSTLTSRLRKILNTFPKEPELSLFYRKLLRLTVKYIYYKQSLGAVYWAVQKINQLSGEYKRKIRQADNGRYSQTAVAQLYGRISSLLKQINPHLQYLERCRRIMRTYPDIKEMTTICIYGFPNVGKTTLLNQLTGARANVAAYAFTTTGINAGYVTIRGLKIQVLDVPGTLARKDKMNVIELQAELVRKELAALVIYVFDLSEYSGYSVEKQEGLYQNILNDKKMLVYLSKKDLTDPLVLQRFPHTHCSIEELKAEIGKLAESMKESEPNLL